MTDEDPTAAELAALRKEKADREAADRKAKDDELEALRSYKQEQEAAAAKRVKAPTPKAEKPVDPPAAPAVEEKPKRKSGVSRAWFGSQDD